MSFWLIQSLNSLALGGVLFTLAAGFSLIFGLMRIANLSHGAYFMLGAYIGLALLDRGYNFGVAVLGAGVGVGLLGGIVERVVLRRLAGNSLSQVLATLGVAFVIADSCLWLWGGDPRPVSAPAMFSGGAQLFGQTFPLYRLAVVGFSVVIGVVLWLLLDKTHLGVMIRASVDDRQMAQGIGVPASRLFTLVFCLGAALAGIGGVIASPILSVYPGLDADMLPLALVVVILGGLGSLTGAFVGSFVIGFIYSFGQVLFPDLAYIILFLPMVVILAVRPRGLFGRITA
ncbi:MAG: branched-chain amino acid ABC transporter permease [Polaromonas sp. 24-62-144]|jgi:branched-chain amino acid transport system permease protein|uniref:branched-chain amino acid ABC transporter permease n=1 Tax=Polaromonas sp. TaxID=1869339 RepID=UPI000BD73CFC|nr:branched-chain amino acid ABC transporter permease [Polaromonas sp.]OYY52904.1 MAG: branched-chain amino acid ABC transporter permease [Polaromonas sp. 35-63-240]OYZ02828.1 MAG: branched-chain amino acid ABC transporter permease [Polaromonas sp. 28-63-22]OYZ84180.1 MAG: branched-chain amino acid ABC transporter permease [Polaromonas sp. 24-62-144]HQS32252.1 branched-chain amino acid ABC transporter permease [Polaromonas sp.]HQS91368.1 branched-chain amino acid ABC transporter permease [Pola